MSINTRTMKTINIKGKEYVEVNERLKHFRANHPKYSLTSEVIEKTDSSILILATIKDDKDRPIATGIAEEIKGSTFINKTSYVENCETSAWGRALANFGIGLDTSVASAEEVQNAIANQNVASTVGVAKTKPMLSNEGLQWLLEEGTKADIQKALATRTVKPEHRKMLKDKDKDGN